VAILLDEPARSFVVVSIIGTSGLVFSVVPVLGMGGVLFAFLFGSLSWLWGMIAIIKARSWRTLPLLRDGVLVQATLGATTELPGDDDRGPQIRFTIVVPLESGGVQRHHLDRPGGGFGILRWRGSLPPNPLVAYDPAWPDRAIVVDALPGPPRIDAEGRIHNGRRAWTTAALPFLATGILAALLVLPSL
jgi:hypothetical protein